MNQEKLLRAFEDTIWMAIRYASGRHTYAPSMVRDAIKAVQSIYPDWKPKDDPTIAGDKRRFRTKDTPLDIDSDWPDDLFTTKESE